MALPLVNAGLISMGLKCGSVSSRHGTGTETFYGALKCRDRQVTFLNLSQKRWTQKDVKLCGLTFFCVFNVFHAFFTWSRFSAPTAPIFIVRTSFLRRSTAEIQGYRSAQKRAPYDK